MILNRLLGKFNVVQMKGTTNSQLTLPNELRNLGKEHREPVAGNQECNRLQECDNYIKTRYKDYTIKS